jgi:Fur family transcriptional regulator, peroxide stress response regulator
MKHGTEPRDIESRNEELARALTGAGLRYTRQREAVFFFLRSTLCHPTADQVCAAVRQQIPSVSLATVYKALEALVEAGLATKLPDSLGPTRFDGRCDRHYHIYCEETGQVRDLHTPYDPGLPEKLDPRLLDTLRRQGFRVTGHRLEIIGHFENA